MYFTNQKLASLTQAIKASTIKKIILRSNDPNEINMDFILFIHHSPRNERSIPRIILKDVPMTPRPIPIIKALEPAAVG